MQEISPQLKVNTETRDRLNAVSPSFCLAKWLQATLHLHRGLTHSCHHPAAHPIPLHEVQKNVAALHNTQEKIFSRQQMMDGKRPEGCQYCWNIEDLGADRFSDRTLKSQDAWAMPFLDQVIADPLSEQILPKYLEVSFSRACNFKCSYCSPAFSTKWLQEVKHSGPYAEREFDTGFLMLDDPFEEESNPYIKAFWQWWPQLKNSLHTFRITGGEPLLSPNTFKVLELLRVNPAPALSISINSNLGVPVQKVDQMISSVGDLLHTNKIAKFHLYTSLESWGERAEYVRFGLDTNLFWQNLERVLQELPRVRITIMVTFNALSITSFDSFLKKVLELREKYSNEYYSTRLCIDVSYLRHPYFQAINILPEEYQAKVARLVEFIADNRAEKIEKRWGFFDFEESKMARTHQWMQQALSPEMLRKERINFYRFFSEYDRRRGTDFTKTFPEMIEFWELCKQLSEGRETVVSADHSQNANEKSTHL